jgi:CubicO group peptidase (beta-lactamase class C family)
MPTETGNAYERQMAEKRGFVEHSRSHVWSQATCRGITHDLNARWLGGYGGNAGLFSTATELLTLLNQCDPITTGLLRGHEDLCGLFWKNLSPWSPAHRTFGFKRNSSLSAGAGRVFSRRAVGHHGFTGCTAWMEPQGGLRMIILSNRIHPRVDTSVNFNRIRRRLLRLMKEDLDG